MSSPEGPTSQGRKAGVWPGAMLALDMPGFAFRPKAARVPGSEGGAGDTWWVTRPGGGPETPSPCLPGVAPSACSVFPVPLLSARVSLPRPSSLTELTN